MSAGLCYSCGTEFGLFKKEHGCKNCGFTFCSKCLSKKIEVPRLNNSRVSVCNRCYAVLKGDIKPENTKAPASPPLAYKKRVEALKAGSSSKTTSHKKGTAASSSDANKYRGMAKADIEIAQRLEKLREKPADDNKKSETFEQLEDRLSVLKGMDPSRYKELNKPTFKPTDRRTQQEQVDDLLEEIAATVALEESLPDPDQAIRDQLKRLRQNEEPNNSSTLPNQDTETSMDNPNSNNTAASSNNVTNNSTNSTNNSSNDFPSGHPYFSATQTNSFDSHCSSTSSGANLSEFKIDGNNLNKTSSTLDKQCSYEKNINFCPGSSQLPPVGYYGLVDPVNINALATEVKQVKEEVARNLKYSDSDNVARAGDRKSWKHFDYEEAELEREAEEIARRLTAEAMREKEEEEKSKQ